MNKPCSHKYTKVDTKTGNRPRHVCLLCGLILNSKNTEPERKDVSNFKKKNI